jgi:hypothetical protein
MALQELQKVLDELDASRSSRKRAWENLQEIRWVLQDSAGMKLPPSAKKTIDLEGKLIKDGVRKARPGNDHQRFRFHHRPQRSGSWGSRKPQGCAEGTRQVKFVKVLPTWTP